MRPPRINLWRQLITTVSLLGLVYFVLSALRLSVLLQGSSVERDLPIVLQIGLLHYCGDVFSHHTVNHLNKCMN